MCSCFRLPDEWVPLDEVVATKTVRLSLLPEAVKARLRSQLLLTAPRSPTKQPRKTKWVAPPSHFLTPDEVATGAVFPAPADCADEAPASGSR
jgi:hypothetical protein